MKLKTKLVLIFCVILIITVFLTDLIVYKLSAASMLNEALQGAYWESEDVFGGIKEYSSNINGIFSKPLIRHYLFEQNDKYTAALKNGEEYYNYTVLSAERLTRGNYLDYNDLQYKEDKINGNNILIFRFTEKGVDFFRVVNITHVYDRLYDLIIFMIAVSSVLTIASALIIFLLTKKTLSPLSDLSAVTREIANGAYGKRFNVKTDDEVGQLGTDLNNMAKAIEKHTESLQESEQKKTMFMANLTHELKTPITAISGYAQLLRTVKLSEADKNDALTFIYEESNRLDRLSKKMMHIMELETEGRIEFTDNRLNDIVLSAVKSCSPAANTKGVTVESNIADCIVRCDFDLMCEVLINLLDNSIKACSEGGCVKITSDADSITVCDNGCGIPACELNKIVEPFYRVDRSRNSKKGGSGLGLALTNEIIKLHGMKMSIESTLGEGTSVTVFFNN